jgi:hypothetical protein
VSTAGALRALVRTIETDVIPTVTDAYARSQLWATTGILGNIANELEPAPAAGVAPAIATDLNEFLRAFGLERALEPDGYGAGDAAALLRENLDYVIQGHASLHYRRAVSGFGEHT